MRKGNIEQQLLGITFKARQINYSAHDTHALKSENCKCQN